MYSQRNSAFVSFAASPHAICAVGISHCTFASDAWAAALAIVSGFLDLLLALGEPMTGFAVALGFPKNDAMPRCLVPPPDMRARLPNSRMATLLLAEGKFARSGCRAQSDRGKPSAARTTRPGRRAADCNAARLTDVSRSAVGAGRTARSAEILPEFTWCEN